MRPNPDPPPDPATTGPAPAPQSDSRLNLLLSFSGWQQESWADRLPTLLHPMGVTALRAGTGRQASQVIQTHQIHIAVVDLGLPLDLKGDAGSTEEGGLRLLDILRRLEPFPPTVVVRRSKSHRDDTRELNAALRSGAFAVIDRPATTRGLETMLDVLARALKRFYHDRWPTGTQAPLRSQADPASTPGRINPVSQSNNAHTSQHDQEK